MAIIPSGLSWSCKEEYLNSEAGAFATISGRRYYKTNDVPAICGVHYNSSTYTMPFLLSTDASAISFRADSGGPWTHCITFEYLGMTWYYNWGEHGFKNATPTTDYPVLDTRNVGAYNSEAVAIFILQKAAAMLTAPFYTMEYNASGGRGSMDTQYFYCGESKALRTNSFTKTDQVFLGWDTSPAGVTVVYTNGQTVTDIAQEGESITLYAVWRKAWAWLIGDSGGHWYTVVRNGEYQTRVELSGISSLSAAVFYEHGFQFTPASDMLTDLSSPRICKWNEAESPQLTANVEAVPVVPQRVIFETITLTGNVKYINIAGDGETLWNVSFDGGTTWYKYNNGWVQVTLTGDGCPKRRLEILTASDWAAVVNGTLKFRCWLRAGGWVKRIRIDY